jgi:uncharacterized C2H2 Zn-finger protein
MGWTTSCCGQKFWQVIDYVEHAEKEHGFHCQRCKDWFEDLEILLSHRCKRLAHEH